MESAIAKTGPITALGAMSGTSLDGVDAAIVVTDGVAIDGFGASAYEPYSDAQRAVLAKALGQWQGADVEAATGVIEQVHRTVLARFQQARLIGFHGQTLAHAPHTQGTLQVGDGAWLATALDRPVIWDFRTRDVEMGGEGAPLAPFFHFACAKYIGATQPLAFLNLGGVGNLTYVDPSFARPEEVGALLAFDTGPANAPVNDLVQARLGLAYDRDGQVAREGTVCQRVLERALTAPYFARIPPKSLDRNDFSQIVDLVDTLPDADAVATLTALSAAAVSQGVRHCPQVPQQVLVTGGGRKNPVLMEMLQSMLACPVKPVEDVGLDGDMLEAQAFAYLGVRVARGLPTSCPGTTGVRAPVGGGRISYPGTAAMAAQTG
ncbi:anhydro-N-acetylmuramic acid kinase [Roseobacter denitrificans]|uniref:Anhydro-N-acetylmuramic acid kinase n=1 Tax=Roseobacter denitrificans (strain ATCC 33942 / OCh 114) TaxID=375451 RepID=ANMK_ROSDO|nr:anhydro-N-acetylmuramic acid kinase [Roseobacter denitrificans]Q164E0.1 RecName: Full=Anhydro-N-acetylmuramic acid kinase; AltName: Full=AnhMurNAc kinase [Roseobacter denitrificans OCh 114]ABG32653.1 conserved hypothetical protein [Roseobacter denitrificans OCh 114]AVL54787.1 anhydro-N-acetylmuramic acid kinase [Roseobacter denitrificans]SFF93302.1 anhydro-N-acetylmuramic acid kinase [Roseobacter denitrificans OCh 114]